MDWRTPAERTWERYFQALQKYAGETGSVKAPSAYRTEEGLWLGRWARRQTTLGEQGRLSQEQIRRLAQIGFFQGVEPVKPAVPTFHDPEKVNGEAVKRQKAGNILENAAKESAAKEGAAKGSVVSCEVAV